MTIDVSQHHPICCFRTSFAYHHHLFYRVGRNSVKGINDLLAIENPELLDNTCLDMYNQKGLKCIFL